MLRVENAVPYLIFASKRCGKFTLLAFPQVVEIFVGNVTQTCVAKGAQFPCPFCAAALYASRKARSFCKM